MKKKRMRNLILNFKMLGINIKYFMNLYVYIF